MNYELAKQLKDAGWKVFLYEETKEYSDITLSELIEACGAHFGSLIRANDGTWGTTTGNVYLAEGVTTPEEAVARLWLALNSKEV